MNIHIPDSRDCRVSSITMYDLLYWSILIWIKNISSRNCTYCGGAIEDNYPPAGILLALVLFPIGKWGLTVMEITQAVLLGIVVCCMLKERQCVNCNKSYL